MIRVREFAEKVGCSPQNIYLHLRNYAAELEGHTAKDRRGMLLDDYAQDFIRGVMYPKQISADTEAMEEINRLRAALVKANSEGADLAKRLAAAESERDRFALDNGQMQLALKASQESEEQKDAELAEALRRENEAKEEAATNNQKRVEAEMREQAAQAENQELKEKLQSMKDRNWFQRLMRQGE